MNPIIFVTEDANALAWWRDYQDRMAAARAKLQAFERIAAAHLGVTPGEHERPAVYRSHGGDSVDIIGVRPHRGEHHTPPAGTTLLGDGPMHYLAGDPATAAGLRLIEMAEEHSSYRLHDGMDVHGIPSRVLSGGRSFAPTLCESSDGSALFQYWADRPGARSAVHSTIARSGIPWRPATREDLSSARTAVTPQERK